MPLVPIKLKCKKPKNYSDDPKTVGEHIKKRRMELGLTLKTAGKLMGVTDYTVINWEYERVQPATANIPAIVCFLGYRPDTAVDVSELRSKSSDRPHS